MFSKRIFNAFSLRSVTANAADQKAVKTNWVWLHEIEQLSSLCSIVRRNIISPDSEDSPSRSAAILHSSHQLTSKTQLSPGSGISVLESRWHVVEWKACVHKQSPSESCLQRCLVSMKLHHTFFLWKDLEMNVRRKIYKKRAVASIFWSFGPDIRLAVKLYNLISKATPSKHVSVDLRTSSLIRIAGSHICNDTGKPKIPSALHLQHATNPSSCTIPWPLG